MIANVKHFGKEAYDVGLERMFKFQVAGGSNFESRGQSSEDVSGCFCFSW